MSELSGYERVNTRLCGIRYNILLVSAVVLCGPVMAVPLTSTEIAELQPLAEAMLKPNYEIEIRKTGSTVLQGSPEWNDALGRSARAVLAARPIDCLPATWLLGGCGRRAFEVPSRSMLPTILDGDYIATALPTAVTPISRGDVLAYRVPDQGSEQHMHRVIGMPGDHIRVLNGVVELNGRKLELVPTGLGDLIQRQGVVAAYTETLPDGRSYKVLWPAGDLKSVHGANMDSIVVPAGKYFMMGDNRSASLDSRPPDGIGMPNTESVAGVARTILLSRELPKIGTFLQ